MSSSLLARNIEFLRRGLGLSIPELSDITDVDPIVIYKLEQLKESDDFESEVESLLILSDYFMVLLSDLIWTDLATESSLVKPDLLALQNEFGHGPEIDRKPFRMSIIALKTVLEDCEEKSIETLTRMLLNQVQKINQMKKVYFRKRQKGIIERNDFFEPPNESDKDA